MKQAKKRKTCEELIDEKLRERVQEAKEILKSKDPVEALNDWVLWWNKKIGKLDLSAGDPADFFIFIYTRSSGYIYYHYQDRKDSAVRIVKGEDYEIMNELYQEFLPLWLRQFS